MRNAALALALIAPLAACAHMAPGQYAVLNQTPVSENVSPYEAAFACVNHALAGKPHLRLAVGQVKDYTGKFSNEASEGGYKITQGGALMVMSALGSIGNVDLVERYDTQIAEAEITLSKQQLLRDGNMTRVPISGQLEGSDYYVVGGVTEANYNIQSGGAELNVNAVGAGARYFVMNVAADLRLVHTKSLRVVKTVKLQKQIVGFETEANIFRFFGADLWDFNAGNKTQEPIGLGVRAVLETGVLDLIAAAFQADLSPCQAEAEERFYGRHPKPAAAAAAASLPPGTRPPS